ncbi:MAG: alpha/beta hydrolase [Bryobacteraceae bacterium]
MRPDFRTVTPILIAAALAAGLGSCARRAPSALERLHPCAIDEGPTDAYCGKLAVWEDRQKQAGRKIDLKIIAMPALRRDPRADPVFVFAGGPGQGAAKIADTISPIFRRLQDSRDLIFIDQRGTGDSHPLECKGPENESDDLALLSAEAPAKRFQDCLAKYDANPRLYTTPVAMDDIDEVRRFLGYGQINLWGGSYGTRAALVFLRRHPGSVRTVTLDGVAPTDMRLPLYFARDSQRALSLLIRDCEADSGCSKRFPDLGAKADRILARLATSPRMTLTHPRTGERTEVPLSRDAVATILMSALYSPQLSALLPKLIDNAAEGDFQGLLALAFAGEGAESGGLAQGMFLSVACAEDFSRIGAGEGAEAAKGTFLGDFMLRTRMKPCAYWPAGEIGEEYYKPVVSDKPVLILSGEVDPVTPPSWAEHVAQHLKNSKSIVVPGAGHGTSGVGCVPKLIAAFIEAGSAAALDTACVAKAHRPPFFVTNAGPESAAPKEAAK